MEEFDQSSLEWMLMKQSPCLASNPVVTLSVSRRRKAQHLPAGGRITRAKRMHIKKYSVRCDMLTS